MRVPEKEIPEFLPLVQAHCPAIRFKPDDLWHFENVRFRVAVLKQPFRGKFIALVRLALHYVWRIPTLSEIRHRHPNWFEATERNVYQSFLGHEKMWGPGDVELVTMSLKRYPTGADLDTLAPGEFKPIELNFRNGAHFKAVVHQIFKDPWTWWKYIGQNRITVYPEGQEVERREGRIVLTNDSYHHSFFSYEELAQPDTEKRVRSWRELVVPDAVFFDGKSWRHYQVYPKRGYEEWEIR